MQKFSQLITDTSPRHLRWMPGKSRSHSNTLMLGVVLMVLSIGGLNSASQGQDTPPPLTSLPIVQPTPVTPPTAQAYIASDPPAHIVQGQLMVPVSFLMNGLGASAGPVENFWRIVYFQNVVEFYPYQLGARFNTRQVTLPVQPQNIGNTLYIPWQPLAELFGVKWRIIDPADADLAALQGQSTDLIAQPRIQDRQLKSSRDKNKTVFLLQYPAAYIESVRYMLEADRLRMVMHLSNATRITASQKGLDVQFHLAGARRPGVPTVQHVKDYLVPRVVTRSGNWQADFIVRINYSAPIRWFTLGYPPRLVVDAQRLFEENNVQKLGGGLSLTKIRKGTSQGPVQIFVARVDPNDGWRVRVAPGGYSVLQRSRPSRIARQYKALVAVNGGFFAYDGAALGTMMINGEWLRLPWKSRTSIAFRPDGAAKIGTMQAKAQVTFAKRGTLPIRDLNGWPDMGRITALTKYFGTYCKLRPGEMAVVVKNDVVVAKPGSGNARIYPDGFTLIASGGARPYLDAVERGERATLKIEAPGWQGFTSALGGGPRLLRDGRVEVTGLRESFPSDITVGRGPRTAIGIDKDGRYIIVIVDGRQNYYSIGSTLTELAYTMQKLGAVDAINLDGGGSTVMTVRDRIVNRPSDGTERRVANALLVMR